MRHLPTRLSFRGPTIHRLPLRCQLDQACPTRPAHQLEQPGSMGRAERRTDDRPSDPLFQRCENIARCFAHDHQGFERALHKLLRPPDRGDQLGVDLVFEEPISSGIDLSPQRAGQRQDDSVALGHAGGTNQERWRDPER